MFVKAKQSKVNMKHSIFFKNPPSTLPLEIDVSLPAVTRLRDGGPGTGALLRGGLLEITGNVMILFYSSPFC